MERLKILKDLEIMDTSPEQMFDDITSLAAQICNSPIALISLVDDKKQYFKSHFGLNINETPIEQSFCAVAIKSDNDFFSVPDAKSDKRFSKNPLVGSDPKIVSYNSVALKSNTGVKFGTLCVIHQEKIVLDQEQIKALEYLSNQVVHLLELRKKNRLLDEYKTQLEQYSKKMEEFASMAAHDLKAPLRGIKSFVQLLKKKDATNWDEKSQLYFNYIEANVTKMNNLIEGLFDFSRADISFTEKEKIDLEALVIGVFQDMTQDEGIENAILKKSKLPIIESYGSAIALLLRNIIGNSLKYVKSDVDPIIDVSFKALDDSFIIEISDNGIGIEEQYLNVIFEPFKRLHSESKHKGTGLGLSTCKRIVEHLNGSINVYSKIDEGSTFLITLPK